MLSVTSIRNTVIDNSVVMPIETLSRAQRGSRDATAPIETFSPESLGM